MSLPIAPILPPSAEYLYCRAQLDWARHLSEECTLDGGVAFTSGAFPTLHEANRFSDASVPPGTSADAVIVTVDAHFSAVGTRCLRYTLNPSAPLDRTAPLAAALLARGFRRWTQRLMRLSAAVVIDASIPGIAVLPARAAYPAARALADQAALEAGVPELAAAFEPHLDDSHYDVLLAFDTAARRAVGRAGLLTVGDSGLLIQVYAAADFRRRGIARLLTTRLLELAARAGLRHVVLSVEPDKVAAWELYRSVGFVDAGTVTQYLW